MKIPAIFNWVLVLIFVNTCCIAWAGVPTSHLLPLQGYATDDLGEPLASGSLKVRIYDADSGGTLVYDSDTDFQGAIAEGIIDVVLGQITALNLDNTELYFLEMDLQGTEMIGDAAAGRHAFYPGDGEHSRPDLEARLTVLEDLISPGKAAEGTPLSALKAESPPPAFGGSGQNNRLEAGLLGSGLFRSEGGSGGVVANFLQQPVGVFAAGNQILKLGPFYLPAPRRISGIEQEEFPQQTRLRLCHPNPFNPQTTISYELAAQEEVWITIHDVAGRRVRQLRTGRSEIPGRHQVVWRGRDDSGRGTASGVYFVSFQAGNVDQKWAVTLLK